MTERRCGPCRACCFADSVREDSGAGIQKGKQCHCEHECATGCGIYATRPKECRDYACAWLLGWGGDGDRPDLSGAVIEIQEARRRVSISAADGVDIDAPSVRTAEALFVAQGYEVQVWGMDRARFTIKGVAHECVVIAHEVERTIIAVPTSHVAALESGFGGPP